MLYIRLFHGRSRLRQQMDDWGRDGPVFGPYDYVHTTYGSNLRLGKADQECDELLIVHRKLVYYDGMYYGDWSVFTDKIFEESNFQACEFRSACAKVPAIS